MFCVGTFVDYRGKDIRRELTFPDCFAEDQRLKILRDDEKMNTIRRDV